MVQWDWHLCSFRLGKLTDNTDRTLNSEYVDPGQLGGGASALIVARPGPWRDALQAVLIEIPRIETIHLASDAASGMRAAVALCPDLVVLDTDQPGGWEWTVAHKLKAACPHARSLVLTND